MARSWIVVADSARARIFESDTSAGKFEELTGLVHEQSRSRGSDLTSDKEGRSFDSRGSSRHSLEKHTSPHEHEAQQFARLIVERLAAGRKNDEYRKIHLAAPPAFLGILRKVFDKPMHECVDKVLNKNIVNESPEAISEHFFGSHVAKRAGVND
ncbi:MAG: host attachment protein [Gammaproteobacteria bacterium]